LDGAGLNGDREAGQTDRSSSEPRGRMRPDEGAPSEAAADD